MKKLSSFKKFVLGLLMLGVVIATLAACGGNGGGGGGGGTAGGGDGGGGGGTATEAPIRIRAANNAPEAFHMNRALLYFGEIIEAEGNFVFEVFPHGQLGNYPELIRSVLSGDLDMVVTPSSNLVDFLPKMAFIEMPYVFPSREVAIRTLQGPWGQAIAEELHESGFHSLGFMENGLRHLTNSVREITHPDQLSGLRFRTMPVPVHIHYWGSLGASAEGSPFPELYTNLATGVFDGQENPIGHIYTSRLYEVQSYMTKTGHVYTAYVAIIGLPLWESLSPENQQILSSAWERAFAHQLQIVEDEESDQLYHIINNSAFPTQVIELTPEQHQAFMDSAIPTHEYFADMVGREAWEAFMQAIRDAS